MAVAKVSRITSGTQQTQNVGDSAEVAGVALVPIVAAPRRLAPAASGLTRPDPSFVTHLIAMAEASPQTRNLRRAAPEEAQAAYLSVANQNRTVTQPGIRMLRTA